VIDIPGTSGALPDNAEAVEEELEKAASKKPRKLSERQKARRMLLQALYQWEMAKAPVNEIMAEYLVYYKGKIDRDFFKEVFPEVVKHAAELDTMMVPLLDRELKDIDPVEISLMRLGLYELAHRIDVPYKVVINEGIEMAKRFGGTEGHKFVNSVLDKLSRRLRLAETRPR